MNTKKTRDTLRPLSLTLVAVGGFIWLFWLNALYMDEFASKFMLSERVLRLNQWTRGLLFVQLILSLILIVGLEMVIAKKRKEQKGEPRETES